MRSNLFFSSKYFWVALAAVGILLIRRFDAFVYPQFWAEDISFLAEAERSGWRSFITPYAGYLHLIPRVIAFLGVWLDPFWQPGFFVFCSLLVILAVVLSVLSRRLELPWKPLLALTVVLVPHTGEVFINPTNVQWIAAIGLLVTLLKSDPTNGTEWLVDAGFILFSGLSGPFILLMGPFFLLRAYVRRTRSSWIVLAGVVAVAAIQAYFVLRTTSDSPSEGPFSAYNLFSNVFLRIPDQLIFGALVTAVPKWAALGIGAILLGGMGFLVFKARSNRLELMVMASFAMMVLASAAFHRRFDLWGYGDLFNGDRYFFIPKVILLWMLIVLSGRGEGRGRKLVPALLFASSMMVSVPSFQFGPYQRHNWYDVCPEIRAGQPVELIINPGWKVMYQRVVNIK